MIAMLLFPFLSFIVVVVFLTFQMFFIKRKKLFLICSCISIVSGPFIDFYVEIFLLIFQKQTPCLVAFKPGVR